MRNRIARLEDLAGRMATVVPRCSTCGGPSPEVASVYLHRCSPGRDEPARCLDCGLRVDDGGRTIEHLSDDGRLDLHLIALHHEPHQPEPPPG